MMAQSHQGDRAFFDLASRAKLRLSGSDRLRFLNGQLTNDVRKATDSTAVEACILNAKGKMDAHVFLHADAECFLLDVDPELRESVQARLDRYIIADDVQIEDVSDQFSIFHVLDEGAPAISAGAKIISSNRYGRPGHDIWVEASQSKEFLQRLSAEFGFCDADCAEIFRIEEGIPRWGRELTPEIIPVEANLEERCIDYEKGCYIGQETISRMKMSGQRNKRLCGLIALSDSPLTAAMRLMTPAEDGKEVGWITSATRSERVGKQIALGYVKRGFNSAGSRLHAREPENTSVIVPAEVVDLPFGP